MTASARALRVASRFTLCSSGIQGVPRARPRARSFSICFLRLERARRAMASLPHLVAGLLGARGADRRLHVLLLLGRRQHGAHAERVDPELAAPALRVVEVLVFLLLDLLERLAERLALRARELLGALSDQLPVEVILRLGEHDALARDQLRRLRGAR